MSIDHHPKARLTDEEQHEIARMGKRHQREKEKLMERHIAEGARLENKLRLAYPESKGRLIFPEGEYLYFLPMPEDKSGLVTVNGDSL